MKRILLMLLVAAMVLGSACGKTPFETETEAAPVETEATPVETEATPVETEAAKPEPPKTTPVFEAPEISAELKKEYEGYLSSQWKSKLDTIKESQGSDLTFFIQTDPHMYVGSEKSVGNMAKALSHFVDLDFIAVTGDLIRGYAYEEDNRADAYKSFEELVRRYTENVNCPILMTLGNHDTNAMWAKEYADHTKQINQYDHYFIMTEKLKEVNGSTMSVPEYKNYYYVDLPNYNVRVIMLNTLDDDYMENYGSLFYISNEQKVWFKNEALNTDRSVIVMSHAALRTGIAEAGNNEVTGAGSILRMVEEFVQDGGDFIAYFCGHVHEQSQMIDSNGRLHISFNNGGSNGEVVFVNLEERTIRTVTLGKNDSDRSFTYGK